VDAGENSADKFRKLCQPEHYYGVYDLEADIAASFAAISEYGTESTWIERPLTRLAKWLSKKWFTVRAPRFTERPLLAFSGPAGCGLILLVLAALARVLSSETGADEKQLAWNWMISWIPLSAAALALGWALFEFLKAQQTAQMLKSERCEWDALGRGILELTRKKRVPIDQVLFALDQSLLMHRQDQGRYSVAWVFAVSLGSMLAGTFSTIVVEVSGRSHLDAETLFAFVLMALYLAGSLGLLMFAWIQLPLNERTVLRSYMARDFSVENGTHLDGLGCHG